jgi:hypothetical protein
VSPFICESLDAVRIKSKTKLKPIVLKPTRPRKIKLLESAEFSKKSIEYSDEGSKLRTKKKTFEPLYSHIGDESSLMSQER